MNTTEAKPATATLTAAYRKEVVWHAVAAAAQYTRQGQSTMTAAEISDEMTVQAAVDSLSKVFPVRGRYFRALARIEDTLISEVRAATGKDGLTDLEEAAKQTYYRLRAPHRHRFADNLDGTW